MSGRGELRFRRALLLVVAATAATAVLSGLARLGWNLPVGSARLALHGPLFVLGVFGTVIALERAVALGRAWAYAAPAAGAAAAVALLAGSVQAGAWLAAGSAAALAAVNGAIVVRQSAPFTWIMLLGSLLLFGANLSWAAGRPPFDLALAWAGFFVLTIAAERLELSRLAPVPRWAPPLLILFALFLAAHAALPVAGLVTDPRLAGALWAAIALWQLRFDLARRTLRFPGLPRYAAGGIMAGSVWLLAGGVLLAARGLPPAGPLYDAILHCVLVGFVLSMVFAHAPIILPAVAAIAIPFHAVLWVPLATLHAGLAARVAGDLAGLFALRRAGSLLNALALLLFFAAVLLARWRSPGARAATSPSEPAVR